MSTITIKTLSNPAIKTVLYIAFVLIAISINNVYQNSRWTSLSGDLEFMSIIIDNMTADNESFPITQLKTDVSLQSALENNQILYDALNTTRTYLRQKGDFFCKVEDNHLVDPWGDPDRVYYLKDYGYIRILSSHGLSRTIYVGKNPK